MPRICYESCNFRQPALTAIETANGIIAQYQAQGLSLTLRQLYYQFVSRGLMANNERNYKKLGDTIASARMAGLVDWDAIVDRTRFVRKLATWKSPRAIMEAVVHQYREDVWADQPNLVYVGIEKDALVGVIEGACNDERVPFLACRGYASASTVWDLGHRAFKTAIDGGRQAHLIYLGDHDPSGIDMGRDLRVRLRQYAQGAVHVHRIALNMDQVEQYNPPPNPAKMSDSRAQDYVDQFGDESWELDALEPTVIVSLVRKAILSLRDDAVWRRSRSREDGARISLQRFAQDL